MQGILITAYKNEKQLKQLITSFNDKCYVIVHIDKKSKINEDSFNDLNFKNLTVLKKYSITWGSINHLYAILDMLKIAKEINLEYVHIISGQDILVCKLSKLLSRFKNNKKIYMDITGMDKVSKDIVYRYQKGCLSSKLDMTKKYIKIINKIYGLIHIPKKGIGEYTDIYKGVVYVSMPHDAYKYCINIAENSNILKCLKHCIIPEEFFFQTVLHNSEFKNNIINNCLRYMDWKEKRNGSLPAILDITDYNNIKNSDYIFARKIDPTISSELITRINKIIQEEVK